MGQGSLGPLSCPWLDLGGLQEGALGVMSSNFEGLGGSQHPSSILADTVGMAWMVYEDWDRARHSDLTDHIQNGPRGSPFGDQGSWEVAMVC